MGNVNVLVTMIMLFFELTMQKSITTKHAKSAKMGMQIIFKIEYERFVNQSLLRIFACFVVSKKN
jgi:hypothetical protein